MGNVSITTLLVRLRVALACLAGRRGSEGCSAGLLAGGKRSQLHLCAEPEHREHPIPTKGWREKVEAARCPQGKLTQTSLLPV